MAAKKTKRTPTEPAPKKRTAPVGKKSRVDNKRGFMSKAEIETIKECRKKRMTADQIAIKLGRAVDSVQKKIDQIEGSVPTPVISSMGEQLRRRPEWKKWQLQFTEDELEQFEAQYVQLIGQFENDIKPTEELQIFQVITLIILIDRTLAEQKQALVEMEDWRKKIEELREDDEPDDMKLAEYQAQYETARAVSKTCADKYKTYSDKQDKMLQQLKATRDQRKKGFEDSGKNFLGWLRWLSDEDNRAKAGREAELMKLAHQKEKVRMGSNHKYRDGTIDRPLLTPETVMQDDEE